VGVTSRRERSSSVVASVFLRTVKRLKWFSAPMKLHAAGTRRVSGRRRRRALLTTGEVGEGRRGKERKGEEGRGAHVSSSTISTAVIQLGLKSRAISSICPSTGLYLPPPHLVSRAAAPPARPRHRTQKRHIGRGPGGAALSMPARFGLPRGPGGFVRLT
jgi:hypothetical protein